MNLKINHNKFKVKVAASDKEQQNGMMKKRFDDTFNGMLFLQGEGHHCFWMKNCIIPLDIIFIKNNKITKIHHSCEPCKDKDCSEKYCGDGELVLEILGGSCNKLNINEGDKLKLDI